MKAEQTIRKQIQQLLSYAKIENNTEAKMQAYDMATALQWVIEKCNWNPMSTRIKVKSRK